MRSDGRGQIRRTCQYGRLLASKSHNVGRARHILQVEDHEQNLELRAGNADTPIDHFSWVWLLFRGRCADRMENPDISTATRIALTAVAVVAPPALLYLGALVVAGLFG